MSISEDPGLPQCPFVTSMFLIANCFLADMFHYKELSSYTSFSFPLKRLVMFASTRAMDYVFSIKLDNTVFIAMIFSTQS